jgi:hypothetical protein
MANENKSNRALRAKIAQEFRKEIKINGLANAVMSVVGSASEKVAIRREVLVQQCRKPSFNSLFREVCDRLANSHPSLAKDIIQLKVNTSKW